MSHKAIALWIKALDIESGDIAIVSLIPGTGSVYLDSLEIEQALSILNKNETRYQIEWE